MRQGQNSKRSRGRGSGRRSNVPTRHQTFDSNGPNVRIRGSAYQVHEKYLALARDAGSSGDRIAAENYLQHAEHYFRIINADNDGDGRSRGQQPGRGGNGRADGDDMDSSFGGGDEVSAESQGQAGNGGAEIPGTGEQPEIPAPNGADEEQPAPAKRVSRTPRGTGRTAKPRAARKPKADGAAKAEESEGQPQPEE